MNLYVSGAGNMHGFIRLDAEHCSYGINYNGMLWCLLGDHDRNFLG